MPRGKPYSGAFKQKAAENVKGNKLSYGEVIRFGGSRENCDPTLGKDRTTPNDSRLNDTVVNTANGIRKERLSKLGKKIDEGLFSSQLLIVCLLDLHRA